MVKVQTKKEVEALDGYVRLGIGKHTKLHMYLNDNDKAEWLVTIDSLSVETKKDLMELRAQLQAEIVEAISLIEVNDFLGLLGIYNKDDTVAEE